MKKFIISEEEKKQIRSLYQKEGKELDVFPVDGGYNIGYDKNWDNFNDPHGTANSDYSKKPTYAGAGGHLKGHFGIDIFGERGTPIVAPVDGKVKLHFGNGNTVIIQDIDGYSHWLGHLDTITVNDDEFVNAGTKVGTLGDSGNAKGTSPHLHYNVFITDRGFYSGEDPIDDLKDAIGKKPSSAADDDFDFSKLTDTIGNKLQTLFKDITGDDDDESGKNKPDIASADNEDDILDIIQRKGKEFIKSLQNWFS